MQRLGEMGVGYDRFVVTIDLHVLQHNPLCNYTCNIYNTGLISLTMAEVETSE